MMIDDIKKVLALCVDSICDDCPYADTKDCYNQIKLDARSLIIEQEQEIARLKAELKQLKTNAGILARGVRDLNHENYELTEKIKQAKIEAVKEFAEKLKDYINDKIIEEFFDMAVGIKYFTIDIDEFEEHVDELLKEYE